MLTDDQKRRFTNKAPDELIPGHRLQHINFPWPVSYPSQIPAAPTETQNVITVDTYAASKLYSTDLIVGRALPGICANPNVRPLVRATLVTHHFTDSSKENVYMYIPAQYSNKPKPTGEVQISCDDVELLPEFDGPSRQKRSAQMIAALKETRECERTVDTYTGSSFMDRDIIIGHAGPEICTDPAVRPLVRASLAADDKVYAYMPARFGVDDT